MEKLQRRSDGFYETPSGLFAVAPRAVSGRREGVAWFEFKASALGEVIRVEWPDGAPVIAIGETDARVMLRHGYANAVTDELMEQYNQAVAAYLEQQEKDEKAAQKNAAAPKAPDAPPPPPPAPSATDGQPVPPAPEAPEGADAKGKKGK